MRRRSLFVSLFAFLVRLETEVIAMRLGLRLGFIILFALAGVNATAQIRADAAAPADQRPTILQAGNGVPLVNIQPPLLAVSPATPTANSMSTETAPFSTTAALIHRHNSVAGFRVTRGWAVAAPASS